MTPIILFFTAFPFLLDIVAAPSRFAVSPNIAPYPTIKYKTKEIFWNTAKLQKFAERLEKECDFDLLDDVSKDLKSLWDKVIEEEGHTSRNGGLIPEGITRHDMPEYHITACREMMEEQNFLSKITTLYNKCIDDLERQWEIYLKIFGKNYTATEKEMRKEIFKKKMEYVRKHNELYRKGNVTYAASLNHLSDWTEEELEKMDGFLSSNETVDDHPIRKARFVDGLIWRHYFYNQFNVVPPSIDWRERHYVNPVRDQGSCGSCYAIAGLGALEAYHKKRTGELVILSVQNILDCTWHIGNEGCRGGNHKKIFEYAESTGVMANSRYPYTMNASHNCQWRHEHVVAANRGYYFVESGNELALRNAVADYGPVAVAIVSKGIKDYSRGIFDSQVPGRPTHTVLVVGYGTDPWYGDFWIVRNCWGFWWGENGYVRIARNKNNLCHIASRAYFPY